MRTLSVSRDLARFVSDLSFKDLPDTVVDRAKNRIMDALAIAIAGRESSLAHIGLNLVRDNKGRATVFTKNLKLPAIDAALVNSLLANTLAQGDYAYSTHPAAVAVPTAIAVAEEEGSSGAEVITALVAGYDIMARIHSGAPSIGAKFRGTGVFGTFGAAVAAGKLLKLNENQLTNALGYAANFSSGLVMSFLSYTQEGMFHAPTAARNGIMAAYFAKEGATASEQALEGRFGFYSAFAGTNQDLDKVTADLGKRFLIMDGVYKPYPC